MIVLDTDHVSLLRQRSGAASANLVRRLEAASIDLPPVTIISLEESMRGWLAVIAKERAARRHVRHCRELQDLFDFFAEFEIISFDDRAADRFETIRGVSIGAMDLKIAAICLVNDATLLPRDTRDFARVPGLKIEDWTT